MSVDDFPQPGKLDSVAARVVALESPTPGVALWWTPLDRPAAQVAELTVLLSAEECARARRFGTDLLRQRWIVGRATLRLVLGRALRRDPSALSITRGRRGRPQLGDAALDFNVSHTRAMALIGIGNALPAETRIGVDVEHGDRGVNVDGLSRKFLCEPERGFLAARAPDDRRRDFLRLWTCKEAMSKATGDALSAPFGRLHVAIADGSELVDGPPPYSPADWKLHPIAMPDGFLATVAIWRGTRPAQAANP